MRLLVCLFVVSMFAACQKADSAERSAQLTAKAAPETAKPAPAPAPAVALAAPAAKSSCGCGGGESCTGSCGEACGGNAPMPQWAAVTDKSAWTQLQVTGMRCGGCGKRIERALASVDGVLAVKTDFRNARVEVVTKPGLDARTLVKPTIDGLGYHVQ